MSSIAILAESHTRVETTVVKFVDAFVAVPLHLAEQPLNCAEVPELERQGDYAFILWRMLCFRGKANPLVVTARCGQGVVDPKVCRSQLYVDDPSIVAGSTPDECAREFDVILLFWLALGFTLAWSKGSHTVGVTNEEKSDTGVHEWIGSDAIFRLCHFVHLS